MSSVPCVCSPGSGNKRRQFHAFVPQSMGTNVVSSVRWFPSGGNKCRQFHAFVPQWWEHMSSVPCVCSHRLGNKRMELTTFVPIESINPLFRVICRQGVICFKLTRVCLDRYRRARAVAKAAGPGLVSLANGTTHPTSDGHTTQCSLGCFAELCR